MIRVYDSFGRTKQEIDVSGEYYLHVSYVREHPPYYEVQGDPVVTPPDDDVWRSPTARRQVAKRAETMRRRQAEH